MDTTTSRSVSSSTALSDVAMVASIVAAAVFSVGMVFLLAKSLGADLKVAPEFSSAPAEEMQLPLALVATAFLSLLGIGLAWLMGRFLPSPVVVFTIGAVIGLVGYGLLAFAKTETASDGMWLNLMHIVAAVPVVGGLLRGRPNFLRR